MKDLITSDFDFELPEHLIAQFPAKERDESRLFLIGEDDRSHHRFTELPDLLETFIGKGALLVFNNTQVIKARLYGWKASPATAFSSVSPSRGGKVELLLCDQVSQYQDPDGVWKEIWQCLARTSKPLREGTEVLLQGEMPPKAYIHRSEGNGKYQIVFQGEEEGGLLASISRFGHLPLPPYIKRTKPLSHTNRNSSQNSHSAQNHTNDKRDEDLPALSADEDRYQTVYAKKPGAVAAPTAGLHFTPKLLAKLAERGFPSAFVTLHVGPGTFAPIKTEHISEHLMHEERYEIPEETVEAIAKAKGQGRKVLAVGTTVVRTLEAATLPGEQIPQKGPGRTRIFIYPPYSFRCTDALLTNFHLPKSTLLMLVSAFAGRQRILSAYQEAIAHQYRFFSYGDAMLLPKPMPDAANPAELAKAASLMHPMQDGDPGKSDSLKQSMKEATYES